MGALRPASTVPGPTAELLGVGVVTMSPAGTITACNEAARGLLAARDGLAIVDGQLRVGEPAGDARLAALLAGLESGGRSALSIGRPSGRLNYQLLAYRRANRIVAFIHDPTLDPGHVKACLRELYDLTEAEAAIAAGVAVGLDLEQLAQARAVTRSTVRWQLKRVFAKTGVNRQTDLVRLALLALATRVNTDTNGRA